MRKTATQIEKDVYRIVKRCVKDFIGGEVYRKGMRPKDSVKEDCEVVFMSGLEGQKQTGEVYAHIFIPYVNASTSSALIPNTPRIETLELKLMELLAELGKDGEYLFEYRYTPDTIEIDDIRQSKLSALITYQRYTF